MIINFLIIIQEKNDEKIYGTDDKYDAGVIPDSLWRHGGDYK